MLLTNCANKSAQNFPAIAAALLPRTDDEQHGSAKVVEPLGILKRWIAAQDADDYVVELLLPRGEA